MDICCCLSIRNKKNKKENWRNRGERGFIARLKHKIEKNWDWEKRMELCFLPVLKPVDDPG